jgi:hypothetical protein
MPLPPQYRLLIAIILLLFLHPLSAQRWEEPQVLPDAPAFVRDYQSKVPGSRAKTSASSKNAFFPWDMTPRCGRRLFRPLTDEAFGRFASFNGIHYHGVVDSEAWYALFYR